MNSHGFRAVTTRTIATSSQDRSSIQTLLDARVGNFGYDGVSVFLCPFSDYICVYDA